MSTPYGTTTTVRRTSVLAAAQEGAAEDTAQETGPQPAPVAEAPAEDSDAPVRDEPAETVAVPALVTMTTAATPAIPGTRPWPSPAQPVPAAVAPDRATGASPDRGTRRRRWPLWTAAACLLVLVGVGAGGYAYAAHYADRAVPGTTVAGQDVAGMTRAEVSELVSGLAQQTTVSVTGDVEATASLTDLGAAVDADATADAALAASNDVLGRFRALFEDNPVDVVTTSDPAAAEAYTTGLIPGDRAVATNATVGLGPDGLTFVTTPASEGVSLDSTEAAKAAQEAARTLTSRSVTLTYSTRVPEITDDEATRAAEQASTLASQSVSITDSSDPNGQTWTPDATTQASWVTVAPTADGTALTASVDAAKVAQWVTASSEGAGDAPVDGVRNINSRGDVVATSVEAVNGNKVTNAEAITTALVEALNAGRPYTGDFTTEVVEASWTERIIADGAEDLVYQAAPGEKWVDVNLSNKTVTAYEGATVVRGPVYMVDGAAATPTVTGTYHVYLQYTSQTMEGDNADGTRYRTEDVPWVSYFYSGYAFHGAPWRSSFGYSGSHGCVNMPVGEARWIYDWVEIGTTVVSHY
ncbi:L,D-transpeptidase family protein [Actinomyces sp. 186855]|nr:L,D-transpeptidase family protein [Actinomyces sp. AC-20-1]MCL3790557.1 L,D-transpeptidase family protein [Actinomyces sp. 187325]MCL3792818.1 L,D-transpeptidase family protein [Actinomyces sp. 186855]MCL3795183.1 L,D-transpeptidase family protein [Actinomyces sp. 217892]